MADLKDLYAEYGRLMVEVEILNNKILEIKRQIAEGLNRQQILPNSEAKEEKLKK